ncbi:MAG: D-alanyl-D-alanine carboxypeptidase/D-alanyl-D-alanine-endopeptidase [Acidobacteria bacterium]|nr:D-alanyl-D-alanine carboxypeptidase/D-alanyl-D-alanine-endopeptidase [Acidobacteriota bacterium]
MLALIATSAVTCSSRSGVQPNSTADVQGTNETGRATASSIAPLSNINEADAELARRIAQQIDGDKFKAARWGILVVSLRDGRTLYARNQEELFVPASNMKLYTTAAALELLGPDYRWRTSAYAAAGPDAQGTISSDLTLYGRGAPDLASRVTRQTPVAHLSEMADALYRRGIRRVRGAIVGDESYLRGNSLGDGWQWNDVQWYFGAEPSALSVDGNEITISITPATKAGEPAQVKLVPQTDYVRVVNDTETITRGEKSTLGVTRGLSDNEVRVWGAFPLGQATFSVRLSVHRPALWAAQLFRAALIARGISVEGGTRARDARVRASERFEPSRAVELAFVESAPLTEVVRQTNKESLNLHAELLLRTLGKERGAALAPVTDPQRERQRGDDEAGGAVLRQWLQISVGADAAAALALHDGSGLSRLNLVTPATTVRLLRHMARSPLATVFHDSLPISGDDGTLADRLRDAKTRARIAAKTGALTYTNSLSGYLMTADSEPIAFSILCNDETGRAPATRTIDVIAETMTAYPFD